MKKYPTPNDGDEWKQVVTQERDRDVQDWDALPRKYMTRSARTEAPANSSDVSPQDKVGQGFYTDDYFYILVANAGNPQWKRFQLSTF